MDSISPSNCKFLIKWKSNLQIGDVDLQIYYNKNDNGLCKELIVSYKSIYINTLNIIIMDLSNRFGDRCCLFFRHESFQMWESKVTCFMNMQQGEYVILNSKGMHVLAIAGEGKRAVVDNYGEKMMLRRLQEFNFLKISRKNCLLFEASDEEN